MAIRLRRASRAIMSMMLWSAPLASWAGDGISVVHTFVAAPGGLFPGPVVGHQIGTDQSTWGLYGTTFYGGPAGVGIAYRLTPPPPGGLHWTESRLYLFKGGSDGASPHGALTFDAAGSAYGTTEGGGQTSAIYGGTVFQLTPPKLTQYFWNEHVLHRFTGLSDGAFPLPGVVVDASGAVFGLSSGTGSFDPQKRLGAVFKLTPPASGHGDWTFSVVHSFAQASKQSPTGNLATDPSGNLYGITYSQDGASCGQLYKATPPSSQGNAWGYNVLYSFSCNSPSASPISLLRDQSGVFYGTGRGSVAGGVFRLQPPGPGHAAWTETDLHVFNGIDGYGPSSLSIVDNSGSIYGATNARHPFGDEYVGGVVFRLDPVAGDGPWTYSQIATSPSPTPDYPSALLARDLSGNLYTSFGGDAGDPESANKGAVFRLVP